MLELYQAYATYNEIMDINEEISVPQPAMSLARPR